MDQQTREKTVSNDETPNSTATDKVREALESAFVAAQAGEGDRAMEMIAPMQGDTEYRAATEYVMGLIAEHSAMERVGDERGAMLRQAAVHYSTSIQCGGVVGVEGTPGKPICGETRLGTVHLLLGELAASAFWFKAAIDGRENSVEAQLGLAEATLFQGNSEEALSIIEPLLTMGLPDPWIIGTSASDMMGRPGDMLLFVNEAKKLSEVGFVAAHRKLQLEALVCAASLYMGAPESGPGTLGVISDLIAGRREGSPHLVGRPANILGVETLVKNMVVAGQGALLEGLFSARAQVVLPGIKEMVIETLAKQGIPVEDDGAPEYIFIGGAGRSGTTLIRTMLDSHSRIHCGPERKMVNAISRLRAQWVNSNIHTLLEAGITVDILDDACAAFIKTLMSKTSDGSPRIAEKTPPNLLHMTFLSKVFPRAQFVHVIRDGRAVIASLLKQDWLDANTGNKLAYCEDIGEAARYWVSMVQAVRAEARNSGARYHEVRYEDLITDPNGTVDEMLAFLGEPFEQQVLEYHKLNHNLPVTESSSHQVSRPLYTEALNRWRGEFTDEQLQVIESIAGPTLRELGYTD